MRAVIATEPGGPDTLAVVDRPDPEPGPGEVLVAVDAAGVNRADLLQREGRYPPPAGASDVLGLEVAGRVVGLGPGVERWAVGDAVCAVVPGGGYAELAVVAEGTAMPLPPGLDAVAAAAVPETFSTAWDNVVRRGGLGRGETLLVHGGASGVGTAALQLGVRAGAQVLATASSAAKRRACEELGAARAIDYTSEDFVAVVDEVTDGRGVDVVLDVVGGAYLERNLRALALEGRLVVIALQGGARAELDLARLLTRRLAVMGSTLRARGLAQRSELARDLVSRVWPGFADGALRPVIDSVRPLEAVAEAHARMAAGEHLGKLVLTLR
ncbi:MAG: NAD(P)H-quinone oxidoreductase [Actinomycetota bacterium]